MSRLDRHVSLVQGKLTFGLILQSLAWALVGYGVLVGLAVVVDKLFGVHPPRPFAWFWVGLGLVVLGGVTYALWRRPTAHEAAVAIDERLGLKEKFSTALYVRPSSDPFAAAAVRDAERTAENVSLHNRFPLQTPRAAYWAVLLAVAVLASWRFLPNADLFGREEQQAKAKEQDRQKAEVRAITEKAIAQINAAPRITEADKEKLELAKRDLEAMLAKPPKDAATARRVASKALSEVDSVKQRIKDMQNFVHAKNEMTRIQQSLASKPIDESGPVGKATAAMAKGEFSEAIELIETATKKFNEMDKKEKEKAAEQMKDLANRLQQMAKDPKVQEKMKDELKKQGANPQLAQQLAQTLQQAANGDKRAQQQAQQLAKQMMQQMPGGATPQAQQAVQNLMQQLQAQAGTQAQAQQMAAAAQAMAQAMAQGAQQQQQGNQGAQGGNQGQQQQQMAAANQQMQGALQQMQAMQQAANAQAAGQQGGPGQQPGMAPGAGQPGGQPGGGNPGAGGNQAGNQGNPGQGQGQWQQGNPNQKGNGMGGPGIGNGGVASKQEAPYDVKQEVSPSQTNEKGRILASTFVKASSERGESTANLQDVVKSVEQEATDEVDTDRVSRQAREAVKDYFQALQEEQPEPAAN